MTTSPTGVDHVVILVNDLDRAAAAYRRLGFQLTPRASHGEAVGTANHLMVFNGNYLELLGIDKETEANTLFRAMLKLGEGAKMLALRTPGTDETFAKLQAGGFQPMNPIRFSRKGWVDGREVEVGFAVTLLPTPPAQLGVFYCEHMTPDNTYHPALQRHDNGAITISGVDVAASDQAALKQRLESLAGDAMGSAAGGATGDARITLGPATGDDRIVSLSLAASNLDALRKAWSDANVAFEDEGDALRIAPRDACGLALRFHKA